MTQPPFTLDEKVIVVTYDSCGTKISHVEKVYKNGRFKVAGWENAQWRPDGRLAGAGVHYNAPTIHKLTDQYALRALLQAQAHLRLRALLNQLSGVNRRISDMTREQAEAAKLVLDGLLKATRTAGWLDWGNS
jgi:hypothetical protein